MSVLVRWLKAAFATAPVSDYRATGGLSLSAPFAGLYYPSPRRHLHIQYWAWCDPADAPFGGAVSERTLAAQSRERDRHRGRFLFWKNRETEKGHGLPLLRVEKTNFGGGRRGGGRGRGRAFGDSVRLRSPWSLAIADVVRSRAEPIKVSRRDRFSRGLSALCGRVLSWGGDHVSRRRPPFTDTTSDHGRDRKRCTLEASFTTEAACVLETAPYAVAHPAWWLPWLSIHYMYAAPTRPMIALRVLEAPAWWTRRGQKAPRTSPRLPFTGSGAGRLTGRDGTRHISRPKTIRLCLAPKGNVLPSPKADGASIFVNMPLAGGVMFVPRQ